MLEKPRKIQSFLVFGTIFLAHPLSIGYKAPASDRVDVKKAVRGT